MRRRSHAVVPEANGIIKRVLIGMAVAAVLALPGAAFAHNAGHVILPDGRCQNLGSAKQAPFVGPDKIQLDLVPSTPRDEFGVSFVGIARDTPISAGECPVALIAGAAFDYTTEHAGF